MKVVCIKQFVSKADDELVNKHNRMKISICKIYELYKQKAYTYILSELPITDEELSNGSNLLRNLNSWTNITKKELKENFRIIEK
jgi:hypothetical protein